MSLLDSRTLTLASATLTGGCSLKSAGSGLPQRIEAEWIKQHIDGATSNVNGAIFDSDNLHFWFSNTTRLEKRRISDGGLVLTFTSSPATTNGRGISRDPDGVHLWWATGTNLRLIKVRMSDGAQIAVVTLPAASNPAYAHVVPGGTADRIWVVHVSSNNLTEYVISTGLASGRTVTPETGVNARGMYATSGGKLWGLSGNGQIVRYNESTLAAEATWTASTLGISAVGSTTTGQTAGCYVDGSGRPHIWDSARGSIDRFKSTAGSGVTIGDKTIVYPDATYGATSRQNQNFYGAIAYSDDGKYILFQAVNTSLTTVDAVRVCNIQTQRARFATTFDSAVVVIAIQVPGKLGLSASGSDDDQKTLCYWSTNGGVDRNPFVPGEALPTPAVISAGGTLTIDGDFNLFEKRQGPSPWIAGTNGEGPSVIWTQERGREGINRGVELF